MPRSDRVAIRCIHTEWLSPRSSMGSAVRLSVSVMTTRVGIPGRASAGNASCARTCASSASTGGISVVIIVLIDGRIGMPTDWVHARMPFMPRCAVSVRLRAVSPTPTAIAVAPMTVK